MKDKNKYTLKIVLVIALAVALIATLISCCVLATKGKLATQASCDNNQTAFANERPDLDCYATAASSTDSVPFNYVDLANCQTGNTYYGFYLTAEDIANVQGSGANEKVAFDIRLLDNKKDVFTVKYTATTFYLYYNGDRYCKLLSINSNNFYVYLTFKFSTLSNLSVPIRVITNIDGGQGQINDLTAQNNALQGQINDLTAQNNALQGQINDLTAQNNALQGQINDLTSENNSLREQIENNKFCTYETVVQDIYIVNGQPRIDWRCSSNSVVSSEPFGNGQIGRVHNSFYLDLKAIRGVDNRPNISFYNTFYLYEKSPSSGHFQTVSFNGVIDFVSYSILHYDSNKGYPIICTQDRGDFNIAFRLKTYNADAMKDVVVHDRTYKTGYDRGHANGISEATQSGHIFESSTSFLKSIFTDMGKLLDIKVFGNITVGTLIGIPLILLVVMAVLKLVRG